jgi:hypothetical protein
MATDLTSTILPIVIKFGTWVAFFIIGAIILGIIWGAAYLYGKNKSYTKRVVVYERAKDEKGNEFPIIVSLAERGRIWYDKKMKKTYFELKNAKVRMGEEELKTYDEDRDLDVPHTTYAKGGEVIFVEKLGVKKYAFGKAFIITGKVEIRVSQADIAEGIRAYDMNAKTFGKKDNQIWAFAVYALVCVLILVLMIVYLNKMDGINKAAELFNNGAQAMLQAKQSTIPGVAPG